MSHTYQYFQNADFFWAAGATSLDALPCPDTGSGADIDPLSAVGEAFGVSVFVRWQDGHLTMVPSGWSASIGLPQLQHVICRMAFLTSLPDDPDTLGQWQHSTTRGRGWLSAACHSVLPFLAR
jgi:hypothetical protein